MKEPTFIDAHVHAFLKPTDENRFKMNIDTLIKQGLEKIIIAALPYHDFDYQFKLSLSPQHIQPAIGNDNFDETILLMDWIKKYNFQQIIVPFFDARFLTEKIEEKIYSSMKSGFRGIKGAFIPESDRVLNVQGIPQALGLSTDHYCRIQQEIFACARELNLPLLYHINLSQHVDWARSVLQRFPQLKINIPHLGYSLRKITDIIEQFENTYTDPAFLIDLLNKNNKRYLNFIHRYSNRIMMGSDAVISESIKEVFAYVNYFANLAMPTHLKDRILRGNAYHFLSLSSQTHE